MAVRLGWRIWIVRVSVSRVGGIWERGDLLGDRRLDVRHVGLMLQWGRYMGTNI